MREGKREARTAVPGLPLVHVIRTEDLAGLSGHDVGEGTVEVPHVDGEALRSAEAASCGFDGVAVAGLRQHSRARPTAKDGHRPEQRMLHHDGEHLAPVPTVEVARSVLL